MQRDTHVGQNCMCLRGFSDQTNCAGNCKVTVHVIYMCSTCYSVLHTFSRSYHIAGYPEKHCTGHTCTQVGVFVEAVTTIIRSCTTPGCDGDLVPDAVQSTGMQWRRSSVWFGCTPLTQCSLACVRLLYRIFLVHHSSIQSLFVQ